MAINFFREPTNSRNQNLKIVIGNFNGHNITWGIMKQIFENGLRSFNSRQWKREYNLDLLFVSNKISNQFGKKVEYQILDTKH